MTTAPAPKSPTERILRECDCPPWVIACAHFDGDAVLLAGPPSDKAARAQHATDCPLVTKVPEQMLWNVGMRSNLKSCPGCGAEHVGWWTAWLLHQSLSESDALAAFYDAEARLLRGEA